MKIDPAYACYNGVVLLNFVLIYLKIYLINWMCLCLCSVHFCLDSRLLSKHVMKIIMEQMKM